MTDAMEYFAKTGLVDEIVGEVSRHVLPDPCVWTYSRNGVYTTVCLESYDFCEGGPDEHGFSYCPFCGRSITVAKDNSDEP